MLSFQFQENLQTERWMDGKDGSKDRQKDGWKDEETLAAKAGGPEMAVSLFTMMLLN